MISNPGARPRRVEQKWSGGERASEHRARTDRAVVCGSCGMHRSRRPEMREERQGGEHGVRVREPASGTAVVAAPCGSARDTTKIYPGRGHQ